MTNSPNEFAQQLDSLFNELHEVLQKNLVNKVNKDDLERVKNQIKENLNAVIKHQEQMDEKIKQLDEKLTRLQRQMQQEKSSPTSRPQDTPQNQSSATASNRSDGTDQFGNNNSEIKIEGTVIAGREKKNTGYFTRKPFNSITTNELIKNITTSAYYNESIHPSTEILANNTSILMTDTNSLELALQLCILIDLQNMHLMNYNNDDLYKLHIQGIIKAKKPNNYTLKLFSLLQDYGLPESTGYNLATLNTAIINLACLNEEDTTARIKNSHLCASKKGERDNYFQVFQSKIKQVINDNQPKTSATTGTDTE